MSWNDYVQNMLVNYNDTNTGSVYYNCCSEGGLVGFDGTVWASTNDFAV